MEKHFDVIVPVALNEALFVGKVLPYIRKNLVGAERVFILTNKRNFRFVSCLSKIDPQCEIIDENELVNGLNFQAVQDILNQKYQGKLKNRTGWYFQQFLKMGFALSEYATDYYLSWDADTVPLSQIIFFHGDNILYNPKREYNPAYFDTLKRLLGIEKLCKNSFISEHMMFSTEVMKEVIGRIMLSDVEGNTWFEKIINATDFNQSGRFEMFSEFETYGNYCENFYKNLYQPRYLNSFREAGFINGRFLNENRLRSMSFDLDTASFELHHSPPFPQKILFKVYLLYLRMIRFYASLIS